MNVNFNNFIGAYHKDCLTGKWSIIGASDKMNEAFNNKMQENKYEWDEVNKNAVPMRMEGTLITSESYEDLRKPTGTMPKHCYGTSYGYQQLEKINKTLKEYYVNQKGSKEELKEFFKNCCKDMRIVLAQERKTTGINTSDNRQIILDAYEQFRMTNSVMANLGCEKEGEELARKNGWQKGDDKDWIYYNANFYYESEELKTLFKEAAEEMAIEWEVGEVDLSERDTDHLLAYSSSFNETWKNGSEYGARICTMIDVNKEPPEGFMLFFREYTEGNKNAGILQAEIGKKVQSNKKIIFDIYDGIQQQFPKFYHLSELLHIDTGAEVTKQFNEYLENFNIYTRYYGTVQMRQH